jgi:transcriptional regulator with XRE-family HTH domain
METLNKEIGHRLREIRHIANEGDKLSARQFAHLLGETTDKILNYENGRAAVTPQLLVNLYRRGFSPVYLLTGEGGMLAGNSNPPTAAIEIPTEGKVEIIGYDEEFGATIRDMIKKAEAYSAAAGDILKAIQDKTKGEAELTP